MQINTSMSVKYYTYYQMNKAEKGSVEFENLVTEGYTEKGNYYSSERGDFTDYQELYRAMTTSSSVDKTNSSSVTISDIEDSGEFLGLTMVPDEGQKITYGVRALLSDSSTSDNPIVQVVSNLGGKKTIYNVEVNKVNPNNATQLEMFALLSYTDKLGITDGGTFGSHQQLEVYGGNASSIGYCKSLSGEETFLNERFDWTSIMEKMIKVYQDAKIPNQAEECKALFDFFNSYNKINKEETDIDFSKFAHNAPNEVTQAFAEADSEITNPGSDIPRASTLLTSESTTCMYETADPDDNDIHYITWYTEEGIFCRKAGQTEGYEWTIPFDNDKQYNKVIDFINQFPRDWNLRFAAHENFWRDFLDGTLDIEGFMEFMNGTNKGIPDFSVTVGDSMYIDKDKMQWAKYTNPLGVKFYSAYEMQQLYMKSKVLGTTKAEQLSSVQGFSVEELLKAKYPGLVYNVGDGTSSDWRTRNDYPFEALFQENDKSASMIENWRPTGTNPKNQRYLAVAPGSKAVMIHPKAQERMEQDPEFARQVMERIESWWAYDIARNEAILPGCTAGMSQAIAIGEDGEIANVLACGGGEAVSKNKKQNSEEDEYDWWEERHARHAMFMQLLIEGRTDINLSGFSLFGGSTFSFFGENGFNGMDNMLSFQSGQAAEQAIQDMIDNGLVEKLGGTICGIPTEEVIETTWSDIEKGRSMRMALNMM
ncbi:MAG: hypothetical protein E7263_10350 [Lachnospiraceae bacterium]|nr:hypothetical protein [Lachnospiraceae bacterium]